MRDLPHLASLVFNRPLLVRADIGRQIIDAIGPRILNGDAMGRTDIAAEFERPTREARSGSSRRLAGGAYMERDGIAVLPIVGSLVRRGSWLDSECGLMSYGLIRDSVAEILMDTSVAGLMLEFDSGGGEANGCFDCADFIRDASAATGKPVWTHANEIMCSAAYALGSSGSNVWVARTAEVGSVGVLGAHVDVSEADKAMGVKWTYIFAGAHKVDGNPHEPLGDGARGRMQADVDDLYEMFLALASQNRGMTTDELRATNADIYRGANAVEAGLADEVGTLDEALEAFAEHVDEMQTSGSSTRLSGSKARVSLMIKKSGKTVVSADANADEDDKKTAATEPSETGDEEDEDAVAKKAKKKADTEDDEDDAKVASIVDRRIKAENERAAGLTAVAEQASRMGVNFDAAAAIRKGMSVADAREKVMAAAATGDADETSAIAKPKRADGQGTKVKVHSPEDKKAMWAKGFKRR